VNTTLDSLKFALSSCSVFSIVIKQKIFNLIIRSKFYFQSAKSENANDDMAMVKEMRKIADSAPFKVIVFNPYFTYIDLV